MAAAKTEAIPTAASEPPGRTAVWSAPLVDPPAEAEGEAALAAPVPGPAVLTASPEADVTVEKPEAVDEDSVVEVAEGET
jgi:hypothetical protein